MKKKLLTLQQIKEFVINITGVNIDTKSRKRKYVEARAMYYKLCRDNTDFSLQLIVDSLENIKNHCSVLHSLSQFEVYMNYNNDYKETYKYIQRVIKHSIDNKVFDLDVSAKNIGKDLTMYKNAIELIYSIPEEHIELLEDRLKAIINCLPKE